MENFYMNLDNKTQGATPALKTKTARLVMFISQFAMVAGLLFVEVAGVFGQTTVFSENFDGAWTTAGTLSPAWTSAGTGNNQWQKVSFTTNWASTNGAYTPTGANSTAGSARFHTYDAANGTIGDLISPTIDMSTYSAQDAFVEFYMINTNGTDKIDVFISLDNGANYGSSIATFSSLAGGWNLIPIYLGKLSTSQLKIKLTATSDYGASDIGVDAFAVKTYSGLTSITTYGNGSFTVPQGVCQLTISAWGAGGSGATGWTTSGGAARACGGGAGGTYVNSVLTVTPGNSHSYSVGKGGLSPTVTATSGNIGGNTVFGANLVIANGGAGGIAATNGAGGTAVTTNSVGTTQVKGGNGAAGVNGTAGGGGGSSGGVTTQNSAIAANGGLAPAGGVAGGTGNVNIGSSGFLGGGGGSGSRGGYQCGNGGNGKLTISWTTPTASATPALNSPICAGATSVSGTSTEATGSTVTVFKNGVSWGTTTTITSNNWSVSGLALTSSDVITAKVLASCKSLSAASTSVTVKPNSSAPVISGSYCAGATSIAGTGVNGSTITVYNDGSSLGTTTVASGVWSFSVSALTSGASLTATQTESGSCTSGISTAVIVGDVPSCIAAGFSPANGNSSVNPSGVTISWASVASATGYDVYFDGTLVSSNQSGTTYSTGSLAASTTYNWKVVPKNGCGSASSCSTYSFTTLGASCTPPAISSTTSTNIACYGQSTGQIVVNATGGFAPYSYSKDNGSNYQVSNTFTGLAVGSYTIIVKGFDDCLSSPSTVTLTQPASALSATASGSGSGCVNATLPLSSSVSGGTSPYSYSWSNPSGLNNGNSAAPTATVGSFASHTLTVTDANGCQTTASAVSITNNSPAAPSVAPVTICAGQTANLTATSSSAYINWYDASGTLLTTLPVGTSYSVSPVTNTTYYAAAVNTSSGTPITTTYTYTGSNQSFVVPAGVTNVSVKMWGAGGGSAAGSLICSSGGSGAYVSGNLNVTPGESLTLLVGQGGKPNATTSFGGGGAGGFSGYSGGGGGRSAIIRGSTELATASGGGGSGYAYAASNGGAGGIATGTNGGTGNGTMTAATGGTQSAGGNGGCYFGSYCGTNGSAFSGGNGSATNYYGGGGGGGYYGGGGGGGYYGGGGAGGSSYTSGLTSVTSTAGNSGNTTTTKLAPNNLDVNYVIGVGEGSGFVSPYTGGNGLIVITYTPVNFGCVSTLTSVLVTVNPVPIANAGSAMAAICSGSTSAALDGSVGGSATGGTWTHNGAGSIANASSPSTATYTAGASEAGIVTLTLTTTGGGCTAVTATKTIVVNAIPAAPTTPVNLTLCNAGTGNISVTAPTITSSQNIAFNIATEPSETNAAPGNQIATATISALPTGTTITSAALTVNNLTALGGSYMSEVRLGLSGAVTYSAVAGSSTSASGAFNYSSTVSSGFTVNTASTALNLLYWDSANDNSGAECTFGAPKAANLTLNYSYPATINWYSAATGGTLLGTGASINPIGTTVLPNANTAGTYNFYAEAVNNGCSSSRVLVTVTVQSSVTAGAIGSDQTICSGGDPAAFTSTTAGTGSGTITYRWESNTNLTTPSWATVGGQTGATYNVPSGLTVTTQYRRITISTLNSVACESAATSAVTVTVQSAVTAGAIGSAQTICSGGDPAAFTSTTAGTGSGTITYRWESNTNLTTPSWATVAGQTGATYDVPSGLTFTTQYRRITISTLNSVACESAATATITVTVQSTVTAGAIGSDQTICSGGDPVAFTSTTAGTGSGTLTYRWESNTNLTTPSWATVAGQTGATYDVPSGLTVTTQYRRITISTLNSVACESAATSAVLVTVNPTASSAGFARTPTGAQFNGTAIDFTTTPVGGTAPFTYVWNAVPSNGNLTVSPSSGTSANFTTTVNNTSSPSASGTIAYSITVTDANGCVVTGTLSPSIHPNIQAPQGSTIICQGTLSSTYTTTTTMPLVSGVTTNGYTDFVWSLSPSSAGTISSSGVVTWDAAFSGSATVSVYARNINSTTTVGTQASALQSTVVTVNPLPTITTQPVNTSICANATGQFTVATSAVGATYQWQYSADNGVTWTNTNGAPGVSGDNTATLSLMNPDIAWNGFLIRCQLTSAASCGPVNSNAVTMTINTTPSILASASPSSVCAGGSSALTASGATDYTWSNGVANGSSFVPASTATYTVTGTLNGCTSTATATVTVTNLSSANPSTGDYIWKGSVDTDWSNASNWLSFNGASYAAATVPPTIANKVIIPALAAGCVVDQPATISNLSGNANDILIEAGASLGLSAATLNVSGNLTNNGTFNAGSGTLNLSGNWTNNGTFTPGTGTVAFVGASGDQTITKTGGETFTYMTVNKAGGNVILANNVTVVSGLTLTKGLVVLGANNLVMGGATLTDGSSISYVKTAGSGVLKRDLGNTGAVFFPVGNTAYNPAELTNTSGSDIFSVRVVDAVYINGTSGNLQTTSVVNRTWMIEEETQGGNSVKMKLYWNGVGEEATSFTANQAFVAHYVSSASMWDNMGGGAGPGYIESTQATTSFSPFTISSSPTFAPLPVELMSLDAQCAGENVIVSWKTASEHNSLNFVVERSEDGTVWSEIQTVGAAGNSNTIIEYAIEDAGAARGVKYYRLIQTDQDGVQKIYGPVISNCGSDNSIFMSFPNPSDAEITIVFNDKNIIGSTTLMVRDAHGRVVRSIALEIQPGTNSILIPDMELEPAVYYLQLVGDNFKSPVIKHSLR